MARSEEKKTETEPANGPGPAVAGDRTEHLGGLDSRRPPLDRPWASRTRSPSRRRRRRRGFGGAEDAEDADASRGGRVVWVPVVVGRSGGSGANARAPCYWPGLCLHMDDDRDLIPESAVAALRPEHAAETHRLAVYFGDLWLDWGRGVVLLEYGEHADDIIASQSHVRHRVRYRRALEEAEEWWRRRERRGDPGGESRRDGEPPPRQNFEGPSAPPSPATDAARSRRRRAARVACVAPPRARRRNFLLAQTPRARGAKPSTLAPLRGVRDSERCPQLEVILAARSGHVGANIALLRERAVGRRVAVHWANERRPFRGVVAGFDPETYTHRVEYDDGDVEPAARLWRETVHLRVPEDDAADREERAARAADDDARGKPDAGKPDEANEDEPESDRVDDAPDDGRAAAEGSKLAKAPGRVESAAKKTRGAKRKVEEESAREVTRPRGDASSRRARGGGSGGRPWW